MPRPRHTGALVIATVLATGAVGAYAATGSGSTSQSGPLALSGSVSDLIPGARRSIDLEVMNPNGREVTVTDVAVTVTAEQAGCPANALQVGRISPALTVPATSSRTTALPVTLAADAPDACQGAGFSLHYATTATGPDLPSRTTSGTKLVTRTVYRTKRVCRITHRHHKRVRHCRTVRIKVRVKVLVPA